PHYHHMLSGGSYDPSQSSNLTGPSWSQYDLGKDTVEPEAPIYDPYGPNIPTAKIAADPTVIHLRDALIPTGTKWILNNPEGKLYYWYIGDDKRPTHMDFAKKVKEESDNSIGDDNTRYSFGSSNSIETPEELLANPVRYETGV